MGTRTCADTRGFKSAFPIRVLRARAEITSHFAAGPQTRWRGASNELYPGRYVRSEQQSLRAAARRGASRAKLGILDDVRHRLRRGASHLPARRSRQNVNLFLREPLRGLPGISRGEPSASKIKLFLRSSLARLLCCVSCKPGSEILTRTLAGLRFGPALW